MMLVAHLWQSTIVVAAVAILALSLKRRAASIRHLLWAIASVKFLVPFSVLALAGSALGRTIVSLPTEPLTAARWLDLSRPFFTLEVGASTEGSWLSVLSSTLQPTTLLAVWLAGSIAFLLWRWRQWRVARIEIVHSVRLESGREIAALERAKRATRCQQPVAIHVTNANTEPVVLGIRRAMILWPEGLSARLTDDELTAIFAHELCHVTRRDNLFGLLQIVVETVFWFYPVVWWLSERLAQERERACDEEVVHMGTDKQSYASGILKVCGFCLRAPVAFASGIGRSHLAQRIEQILSEPSARAHAPALTLTAIAAAMIVAPVAVGVVDAHRMQSGAGAPATQAKPATIHKPGKDVSQPKLVKETKPRYTAAAMQAKIQGGIKLTAVVLEDGTVGDVKVKESLDKEHGLDDEAVKTMKTWVFTPGTKDGRPVAVEIEVEMSFRLK
jgi:bla regulator protein blaR1